MGSWNGTCAISNLHITSGTPVTVFMLLENKEKKTFCYGNALYNVCPVPFYGKYNDYGAVEDCFGPGLDMVVNTIRDRLYEFGTGANSCHDIPVNKENFDIDMLFEADHEDRLGIDDPGYWNADAYSHSELERERLESGLSSSQQFELDRLAAKIKQLDSFRRVTHIIVHSDVFKSIMEKWYIEEYLGAGLGNTGCNNSYINVYFKDIEDSIPEYIEKKKEQYTNSVDNPLARMGRRFGSGDDWRSSNLATKWLGYIGGGGESNVFDLIDVKEVIVDYAEAGKWDDLAIFVKEVLTTSWINAFMSSTRKLWSQQTGLGAQSSEPGGYILLADTIKSILTTKKAEYDEE